MTPTCLMQACSAGIRSGFTQKDSFGASELYSLAEYKVRNSAPFEKEYLMGKYGGIPVIGQFERLFDLREEEYGSTDEQA